MFNPIRKQLRTTCHLAAVVLTVAFTATLAAACQQDQLTDEQGNTLNPDGTVTITRLQVGIGEGTAATADAATRAADSSEPVNLSRPGIDRGYITGVKTTFVEGDVLHLAVFLTEEEFKKSTPMLSTATLTDGVWTLNPDIALPQKVEDIYSIQIFYDGKKTEYERYVNEIFNEETGENDFPKEFYSTENFRKAFMEKSCHVNDGQSWPSNKPELSTGKTDDNGNIYFHDALQCVTGKSMTADNPAVGSIAIGTDGTLNIKMAHAGCLLRITSVTNDLGSAVARAEVVIGAKSLFGSSVVDSLNSTLWGKGEVANKFSTGNTIPGNTTPGTDTPWQSVIGCGVGLRYPPWFIRITLVDGSTYKISLPNEDGSFINSDQLDTGLPTEPNKVYSYHLNLRPGKLTAELDVTDTGVAWIPQDDPAVPKGYTAIRTREDLEAIASFEENMKGNYILMNDIDLALKQWTPLGSDGSTTGTFFSGRFNGNGHTLHGLTINSDTKQLLGLFAQLNDAIVYNLHFSGANVECTQPAGNNYCSIGTLAGTASSSTISLCSTTACTVTYSGAAATGSNSIAIGSLVGSSSGISSSIPSVFTRCHATDCTVTGGNANSAGGLVGQNTSYTRLVACYTRSCNVTGSNTTTYAGGLTGSNKGKNANNIIYGCYAAGVQVSGGKVNGALVGLNEDSNVSTADINLIASCYATTLATGSSATLALVGHNGKSDADTNTKGTAKIIACISALTDRSKEQLTDLANVVSITARGTARGYLPLKDAKELAALATISPNFGFTADGTGITVQETAYTAAGIWFKLIEANKMIAPIIKWKAASHKQGLRLPSSKDGG